MRRSGSSLPPVPAHARARQHELGHALAATLHKIRVLHVGFFLSAGLPGAYVSVDPAVAAHRPSKQLRVYCAGVWHNLVCGARAPGGPYVWQHPLTRLRCRQMLAAAAMAALACVPALVSPLLATPAGSGLCVAAVHADSPLAPVLGVGDAVTHANGRPLGEAAAWWSEIDAARGQPLIAPAVAEAEGEEVVEEPITQESRTAHPAGPHLHAAGEWGRMAPSLRARAVGREPGSGEHSQYRIGAPLCVPSSYLLPSPHAVDAVSETPAPAPAASQEEDRESHIRPDTVVPPPPTPPAGLRGVGGDEPGLRAAEAYEERTRLAAAAADAGPVAGPVRHLLRGQGTAGMRGGMRMGQVEELSGAEPSAAEPSAAAAEARAAAQSAAAARLGQSADPRRCCPRYMVPAVQRRSALTQDAESQPPVPSLQCVAVPVAALGVTTPPAAGDAASVLACVPSSSLAEDTEPAQCRAACESGAAATLEGTACARPLLEGNDVMVRLDRPNATAVLFHGPAPALTRGLTLGAWHPRPWLRAALGGDEGPASQREAAAPDDGRRHPLRGSHAGEAGPQPRRAAPGKGQSRALLAAALWLPDAMGTFLWLLACVSTSLAVLNSVPCHGLDGQHAFTALLAPGGKGQAAAALRWLLRGGTALLLANLVAVAASALPAS